MGWSTKWKTVLDLNEVPEKCWLTVEDSEGNRSTVINSPEVMEGAVSNWYKVIAWHPLNAPDPYMVDTYEDGWLLPSEAEMTAWKNFCEWADQQGKQHSKKLEAVECKIFPKSGTSVFGRPYAVVFANGTYMKVPSEYVRKKDEKESEASR